MSKLEDRIPNAPLNLEDILERGRAVDLLRQTLDALGPDGEHWIKDTARAGNRRCLAQTMFDIARQEDSSLNGWTDDYNRPNHLTRAGIAIIESNPRLAECYLRDEGDIKSACQKGIEDLMAGYAYNEQRELELI